MSESLSHTQVTAPSLPDEHGFGMVLIAPLSERSREHVLTVQEEIGRRLGTELWLPHLDITLGRILEMGRGRTRDEWEQRFNRVLPLATAALRAMALGVPVFDATFDALQASPQAIIARVMHGVEPVVELRRRFMCTTSLVPEATPSTKHVDFVHATLARYLTEGLLVDDVRRVTAEVARDLAPLPFSQAMGRLIIAEEIEKYELVDREEILLRGVKKQP